MLNPLVSCLCLTENRVGFLRQAVYYFQQQTYLHRELIIVYPDDDLLTTDYIAGITDNKIKGISVVRKKFQTIGSRRNVLLKHATGDYFCQWDDDDWYHEDRIKIQLETVLKSKKDGSVLKQLILYNTGNKSSYITKSRPWEGTIMCNLQAVRKHNLEYDNMNEGEDTAFLKQVLQFCSVCWVNSYPTYIYIQHSQNTCEASHFSILRKGGSQLSGVNQKIIRQIITEKVSYQEGCAMIKKINDSAESRFKLWRWIKRALDV